MGHPLDYPINSIEKTFGCSFVALRGKTVRVVSLTGGRDRIAVFLGLLTDERGDTYAVLEEGKGGVLEQVHSSRILPFDPLYISCHLCHAHVGELCKEWARPARIGDSPYCSRRVVFAEGYPGGGMEVAHGLAHGGLCTDHAPGSALEGICTKCGQKIEVLKNIPRTLESPVKGPGPSLDEDDEDRNPPVLLTPEEAAAISRAMCGED